MANSVVPGIYLFTSRGHPPAPSLCEDWEDMEGGLPWRDAHAEPDLERKPFVGGGAGKEGAACHIHGILDLPIWLPSQLYEGWEEAVNLNCKSNFTMQSDTREPAPPPWDPITDYEKVVRGILSWGWAGCSTSVRSLVDQRSGLSAHWKHPCWWVPLRTSPPPEPQDIFGTCFKRSLTSASCRKEVVQGNSTFTVRVNSLVSTGRWGLRKHIK